MPGRPRDVNRPGSFISPALPRSRPCLNAADPGCHTRRSPRPKRPSPPGWPTRPRTSIPAVVRPSARTATPTTRPIRTRKATGGGAAGPVGCESTTPTQSDRERWSERAITQIASDGRLWHASAITLRSIRLILLLLPRIFNLRLPSLDATRLIARPMARHNGINTDEHQEGEVLRPEVHDREGRDEPDDRQLAVDLPHQHGIALDTRPERLQDVHGRAPHASVRT